MRAKLRTSLAGNSFRLFSPAPRLISVSGRREGFSLIEVVVVMAVIALALTLVGPRIGAGIGRLELQQAGAVCSNFVKIGRAQAQRADRQHFVVIDSERTPSSCSIQICGQFAAKIFLHPFISFLQTPNFSLLPSLPQASFVGGQFAFGVVPEISR